MDVVQSEQGGIIRHAAESRDQEGRAIPAAGRRQFGVAISEAQRLDVARRAKERGEYLIAALRRLRARHSSVGDVRGLGLLCAVDLVDPRDGKRPLATKLDKIEGKLTPVDGIAGAMMRRGIYVIPWLSHLVIAPPLIIDTAQIDDALAILSDVLEEFELGRL